MRSNIKKIFFVLPLSIRSLFIYLYELFFAVFCVIREALEYSISNYSERETSLGVRKKILIYQIGGLGFGGTEKTLQIIANNICDDYDVYFLASEKGALYTRKNYLDKRVNVILFDYTERQGSYPFYIKGMTPHIKNIIHDYSIDLLITADSGYTQYPINTISTIPIIMINIFGSPALQSNIVSSVFISNAVKKHSEKYIGEKELDRVIYLPVPEPAARATERAKEIRKEFSIPEGAFVFGRIGRDSNDIFDSIGIKSFQITVRKFPSVYYLIMSAPQILKDIVEKEKIPNVHFLPPSADELDIWGFHYAINCLAHFRRDGETYGMNITESMRAGNPIITHKSSIWNAHLEYLEPTFSRVADIDDFEAYTAFMEEYVTIQSSNRELWDKMKQETMKTTEKLFSIEEYTKQIKLIITKFL